LAIQPNLAYSRTKDGKSTIIIQVQPYKLQG